MNKVIQKDRIPELDLMRGTAVVSRDVPPNTIVGGVPARVIKTIDEYEKKMLADPNFKYYSSMEEVYETFGVE